MENLAQTKVGEIVASNFRTSLIFTSHNIDFCCGGGVTLAEACEKKHQNIDVVIEELEQVFKVNDQHNWQGLELDNLIDLIVSNHHNYVKTTIPVLRLYLDKLCKVHGSTHQELFEIRSLFEEGSKALSEHMEKEEMVLFPYVKAMVSSKREGFPLSRPHFQQISNPIHCMEAEHENEGERFQKISRLTQGYTCPPDGCQTFKVTYALLQEFESDLHTHIHLENNILFPSSQNLFNEMNFEH